MIRYAYHMLFIGFLRVTHTVVVVVVATCSIACRQVVVVVVVVYEVPKVIFYYLALRLELDTLITLS